MFLQIPGFKLFKLLFEGCDASLGIFSKLSLFFFNNTVLANKCLIVSGNRFLCDMPALPGALQACWRPYP